MLLKELRDLEANGLFERKVYNTIPVTVEYELTESGKTFQRVMGCYVGMGFRTQRKYYWEAVNLRIRINNISCALYKKSELLKREHK
ncbi:MAG: winged helix-turn-helix transcriptional regulator [Chitinophagales bacterium]